MTESRHCRIRSVRDKATQRKLILVHDGVRRGLSEGLVSDARLIADIYPEGVAAFVVMAIGQDGTYQIGHGVKTDTFVGPSLMTALISEIMRRELATEYQILDFSIRHGWLKEND